MHGHIKWLLNKGMKTIFYPCVSYEDNLVPNTDNHYNCPVVANYPLVVGANMPELRDPDVRYMHPYFNLANHELMVDRIVEEFAWASVSREEAETAVKAAYAEDKVFKHDVQQEGLKALAYMKEHDCRGIVLAGRPYHIDPEINHGIPETICALGMVVLSEDSICELQPGEAMKAKDKVRLSIIRQVKAEVKNIEVNERRDVTEEDVNSMIKRLIKQTSETLEMSIKAGTDQERTDNLTEQVKILESLLPAQVSGEELEALIEQVIAELGATSKKQMGQVMGALGKATGGNFDKPAAAKIVGAKLA